MYICIHIGHAGRWCHVYDFFFFLQYAKWEEKAKEVYFKDPEATYRMFYAVRMLSV
jgi:hypothetical protein